MPALPTDRTFSTIDHRITLMERARTVTCRWRERLEPGYAGRCAPWA